MLDLGKQRSQFVLRSNVFLGGRQVAILVPTTILALQHFKTFGDRLKEFGVTVDYVNRFSKR